MTIIEAVQSGKKFRRKAWTDSHWIYVDDECVVTATFKLAAFTKQDLMEHDWEVEKIEEKITVTKIQILNSLRANCHAWNHEYSTDTRAELSNLFINVEKLLVQRFFLDLGFKEQ